MHVSMVFTTLLYSQNKHFLGVCVAGGGGGGCSWSNINSTRPEMINFNSQFLIHSNLYMKDNIFLKTWDGWQWLWTDEALGDNP